MHSTHIANTYTTRLPHHQQYKVCVSVDHASVTPAVLHAIAYVPPCKLWQTLGCGVGRYPSPLPLVGGDPLPGPYTRPTAPPSIVPARPDTTHHTAGLLGTRKRRGAHGDTEWKMGNDGGLGRGRKYSI